MKKAHESEVKAKERMKQYAEEVRRSIGLERRERELDYQELLMMGEELEREKLEWAQKLQEAKEIAKNLREKLEYQKKMESTRDRMIIEKARLMKSLINQESISGQMIKKSAGKETFDIARGIS